MIRRAGGLEGTPAGGRAELAREYFIAGHLIDRAGMPHAIAALGRDGMTRVAIEEWSGASPIYTRRMQRALGFVGTDVSTIFKGMQLDIGAPPEFLDFRFEVDDAAHGRFHLDHCGALVDVEPMGDDFVTAMCHHIEDPTFDATAAATNPRARMRPVHRPPRVPADRHPHCEWVVDIDESRSPIPFPVPAAEMSRTLAADAVLEAVDSSSAGAGVSTDGGGKLSDYSGRLERDLRFEDFSGAALAVLCAEAALQGHLLAMSFARAVERVDGPVTARELLEHQLIGSAGLTAGRLSSALGCGGGTEGIAAVIGAHPLLAPRGYVEATVEATTGVVRVEIGPCPAVDEAVMSWLGILVDDGVDAIAAMAEATDPRARVRRIEPGSGVAAWEVVLGDEVAAERGDVTLARLSSGSEFVFRRIGRRDRPAGAG